MIRFPALPSRALTILLVVLACYVALTPVSAIQIDESQVQVMMQAAQQTGFGWTVEALRNACTTRYAGVYSCNETGFVTSIVLNGASTTVAPPAFSGLVALKTLSLTYFLNGTLPSSWSSLTQLETLTLGDYLATCRLTGALPESWSAMTNLKTLQVFFADPFAQQPVKLIASTPPSWLGKLESVSITCANWPNAALPASIGTSTTLKNLRLRRCVFKGDFPSGLITNTHIASVDFNFDSPSAFGSGFTFPSDFSGMTSLTYLSLSGCSFKGSLPTAYPPNLDSLILSYMSQITGTFPQSIVDHPTLTTFFVGGLMYGVSGPLPGPSHSLTSPLAQYSVAEMSVTGTIPSSILGLSAYVALSSLPKLSGSFPTVTPASASSCRTTRMYISNLNLAGAQLPTGLLENCASLKEATFIDSGFTGQLPDFTGARRLESLTLDSNAFGGTLPIIKLTTQATFSCNNCSLTGVVDPFYLNTTAFSNRNFAQNKLDLCSNNASILETGFVNKSSNCDLVGQTPRECGCPDIWPTSCFYSRPMAPDCDNLPPDSLQPISPVKPPTAAAPASIPSIALIATLLVIFMTFL